MNAMEHGNGFDPALTAAVRVRGSAAQIVVEIDDHGGARNIPGSTEPDLEAKLAGEQEARGWGLFLIRHLVDEMTTRQHADGHTVALRLDAEGGDHAHA